MINLASIAEGVLHEYLLKMANEVVAEELMEDDPECQLLSNSDWTKVLNMIVDASVNIKVAVH